MKDFNKQLTEIYPKLKKHAIYVTNSENVHFEADDLANETIMKGLKKQHLFDGENLLAWLKTLMKNIIIDEFRKGLKVEPQGEDREQKTGKWRRKSKWKTYDRKKREVSYGNALPGDEKDEEDKKNVVKFIETYDPKEKSSEDVLEGVKNIKKLHYYISKLGKKCQEIFRLYMEVEGSFLELSKRMNIPLGTVQSRFHRCKEKLLKIILKESPGEANEI